MTETRIRTLTREDLPACATILQRVYNNELWQAHWSHETAQEYLTDFFDGKKFVGYAAEENGQVIGALFAHEKVWWNNSEVFIEEMFVLPERQGQGIGSRLMDAVWQYVTEHKLAGLTLSTNRYAPAPAFYRKHGFADCEHVLFMAKEAE